MSCESLNIRIEPMDVYWQIEQKWSVKCVADVAGSLEDKYFMFSDAKSATKYYAWFDTGTGSDPALVGRTAVKVTLAANDSANTVATKLAAVLLALTGMRADVDPDHLDTVVLAMTNVGQAESLVDGSGPAATGFTFSECQKGRDVYLGAIDGDFSLKKESEFEDVTSHQTGVTPITKLLKGTKASVEVTLIEADTDKIKNLMDDGSYGANTPSGGTEVFGVGLSNLGKSVIPRAARLLLHPVVLATSDTSRDYAFWLTAPNLSEITFSGETKQTLKVEFATFKDASKPDEINLFAFHSDWKQYLPKES